MNFYIAGNSSKNARRRSLKNSRKFTVIERSHQHIQSSDDDDSKRVFEVLSDIQQFLNQLSSKILNPQERDAKQNLTKKIQCLQRQSRSRSRDKRFSLQPTETQNYQFNRWSYNGHKKDLLYSEQG